MRLVKLVRDNIDIFLDGRHAVIEYTRLPSEEEHRRELRKKLLEEAAEYVIDPCKSELADVLEVVHALATVDLHCTFSEVNTTRLIKKVSRGGFESGMGMYAITPQEQLEAVA